MFIVSHPFFYACQHEMGNDGTGTWGVRWAALAGCKRIKFMQVGQSRKSIVTTEEPAYRGKFNMAKSAAARTLSAPMPTGRWKARCCFKTAKPTRGRRGI